VTLHRRARALLRGLLVGVLAAGCAAPDPTPQTAAPQGWSSVLAQAQGQTVSLWMYNGDSQGNAYVDNVSPRPWRRTGSPCAVCRSRTPPTPSPAFSPNGKPG